MQGIIGLVFSVSLNKYFQIQCLFLIFEFKTGQLLLQFRIPLTVLS